MPASPEIVQEKKVEESISKINEKKEKFIQELIDNLDQTAKDYGPFLMEKLLQRLEKVVEDFNTEFNSLVKTSFENWKIKDSRLREMMVNSFEVQVKKESKVEKKSLKSPNFIKDVKFGPTQKK